ncbi:alanine racemase [Antiquaquibacter oligotrophicus]|nr:alanine racemase [Antiquaquibacter oligotrophicus]UDF14465.1 alanine racemase [Antiquaquibacter oligotrophicus]
MIALTASSSMLTEPRLTVDLDAVGHNTRTLASKTTLMAVVKADGFGHGAAEVARTALANGAIALGVATLDEAIALRAVTDAPILAWVTHRASDFDAALLAGIELAVPSVDHLDAITRAARTTRLAARVHLHLDTGMARDGAPREQWLTLAAAARRAERLGQIDVVGMMSHLGLGEKPGHPATAAAVTRFVEAEAVLRSVGLRPAIRHLAATAAALNEPAARFDLCRIGAGLYGIGAGLREAMTLTAPVVSVRDVPRGTPVGYGHSYVTDRATRLALIPLGYADGIPRIASGNASVLVRGRRTPLAGTVSMDQLVIDVGTLGVEAGDIVTVFGPGDDGEPTIADWARWSRTIPHEIMTGIGSRVVRSVA